MIKRLISTKSLCQCVAGSVALLSLNGFAGEPIATKYQFDEKDVQWAMEAGDSSVSGQAFIKLEDGSFKGCDGFTMELLPVTDYSKERIFTTYKSFEQGQILISQNPPKFTPDPKAFHDLVIKKKCGEGDKFSFENVSAGEYFVMAFIFWKDEAENKMQGGGVMKKITLGKNKDLNVTLKN